MINRQYRLQRRPDGPVAQGNFAFIETPVPELLDGQALAKVLYINIDQTNRLWMTDRPQYMAPVGIGDVMRGVAVGVIVDAGSTRYKLGELVSGLLGWQDYCVVGNGGVQVGRLPNVAGLPTSALAGVCGATGMTAYFGLLEVGQPKSGETVVVSGAAGGVGSVAGQIARIRGCRTIGIARGPEKCRHIVEKFGFDHAIDCRAPDFVDRLVEAAPYGIDINFENVGGPIMDTVMARMRRRGRVVLCGMISAYEGGGPMSSDLAPVLMQRLRVEGFIVTDYASRFAEATSDLIDWVMQGAIRYDETVIDGLDQAPNALARTFDRASIGKIIVKVHDEASGKAM